MKKNIRHPDNNGEWMFLRVIKKREKYKDKKYLINFHFYESYDGDETYIDDVCEAINNEQIISQYRKDIVLNKKGAR